MCHFGKSQGNTEVLTFYGILVPRSSVSFGHVVGENEGLLVTTFKKNRVALGTRMHFTVSIIDF